MRKSPIIWFVLAAACGTVLFHTSQRVTDGRAEVAATMQDIAKEKESIRVLEAEWSYLNQPDRLEKLAREHLHLEPMKGKQFTAAAGLDALPVATVAEAPKGETTADDETEEDAAVATVKDDDVAEAKENAPPPAVIPPAPVIKSAESAPVVKAVKAVPPAPVVKILKPSSPPALTAGLPAPQVAAAEKKAAVKKTAASAPNIYSAGSALVIHSPPAPKARGFDDVMKSLGAN